MNANIVELAGRKVQRKEDDKIFIIDSGMSVPNNVIIFLREMPSKPILLTISYFDIGEENDKRYRLL